jgi:protein-tyrosine phosphatase
MILFVCEGNVCRSPMAAALLVRALAGTGVRLPVGSAGTRALVGSPVDASTATLAAHGQLDVSAHRGRQLDQAIAASASLLLAATRRVRSAAVEIHPPAVQYAFTIRQLGRILRTAESPISTSVEPEQRMADLRAYLIRNRGLRPIDDRVSDDIVDPYGRSMEVHAESIAQLVPAIDLLSRALGGRPVDWPD